MNENQLGVILNYQQKNPVVETTTGAFILPDWLNMATD